MAATSAYCSKHGVTYDPNMQVRCPICTSGCRRIETISISVGDDPDITSHITCGQVVQLPSVAYVTNVSTFEFPANESDSRKMLEKYMIGFVHRVGKKLPGQGPYCGKRCAPFIGDVLNLNTLRAWLMILDDPDTNLVVRKRVDTHQDCSLSCISGISEKCKLGVRIVFESTGMSYDQTTHKRQPIPVNTQPSLLLAAALSTNPKVVNSIDWSVHALGREFTVEKPLRVMLREVPGIPRATTAEVPSIPIWRNVDLPGYEWLRVYAPTTVREVQAHTARIARANAAALAEEEGAADMS